MRHFDCGFDTTTTISLESQLDRLALEANFLSNVIETFSSIIPNLTTKITEGCGQLTVGALFHGSSGNKEVKELAKKLALSRSTISFISYKDTLVSVPEGFKGNLVEYLQTLTSISTEVFQGANQILGEYSGVLAAFLTNKENKISLKDHTDLFHRVQKRREQLTGEVSKFFTGNSDLSKAKLGTIINRLTDVDELINAYYKLDNGHVGDNLKDIAASTKKAVDMLNLVIHNTEAEGAGNVSGAAANNIAKGAYEIGKYIEFVAIFKYRVEQALGTVVSLLTKLSTLG